MNQLVKYAMMRSDQGDNVQNRAPDRYNDGRYAPARSAYDDMPARRDYEPASMSAYNYSSPRSNGGYPYMGDPAPVRMGDDEHEGRRSWKIIENNGYEHYADNREPDSMRQVYGFNGDRNSANGAQSGHAASKGHPTLTKEMAEEWMYKLQNADGTSGPHWSLEDVKRLMQQKGIHADPLKLWVGMNAEYSDGVAVNRKFGVDNPEYYLESAMTKWLNDRDAVADKPAAYYMYVVKH